jgi:phosphopantetheinyl transferase
MAAAFWLGEVLSPTERRAALLAFCATHLKLSSRRLSLAHDALSAPLLLQDGATFAWRVSSSSRQNVALFGLSRERIGVDLELLPAPEPAWNVLHEQERASLAALPEARQAEAFLSLWTAKEAYLKALGLGLRREPAEICVRWQGDAFSLTDRGQTVIAREARFWRETVGAKTALCACVILPDFL